MEEMQLEQLKANPKNPRTLSKHDGDALAKSMREFGDLSAIVFNATTQQLVGGHQRVEILKKFLGGGTVYITQRFEQPDTLGTTAYGYVVNGERRFPYREVNWPLERELAANIAANRIQGNFDLDLLAEVNYMIKESNEQLLELTGQTQDEIDKLQNAIMGEPEIELPEGERAGFQQITFTVSDKQAETLREAMEYVKANRDFSAEENQNSNGNAIYFVAKEYLGKIHNELG